MAQDPGTAFTQNLVAKYMQFKLYQFQVELDERREKRYDRQLELDRERNRLYAMNIKSQIEARGIEKAPRGTVAAFREMGYSEEESQLGQDIAVGLAPRRMTPSQQLTAGKLMLDNAITIEGQEMGQQMMNDAMAAIKKQREPTTPSPSLFPSEEPSPPPDTTEQPLFLQGMREAQPDAGMFDRVNKLSPSTEKIGLSFTLDELNRVYKELSLKKKGQFEFAWKKAKAAGATQDEFLKEWLRK